MPQGASERGQHDYDLHSHPEQREPGSAQARGRAVRCLKSELGIKAIGREVMGADGVYELRELDVSYNPNFVGENSCLRPETAIFGTYAFEF
jgi:hypothetical protein